MSAQELTASRSTSYAADSTLYLYTSLTAGSSHIITATSTLETILHGNRLDFESVDTATDEKARTLWRRRAGGKKLPGLVKYGTVIGVGHLCRMPRLFLLITNESTILTSKGQNIDDIETWNEQEILVDKIRNVPGRIPLDEKMEIFESSASVEPSSIKASLKDVKINQPAAAPTLTEKLQSKKIHRRLLSDAEFEDLLNAAKAEQPDQATIDALLYESQRRQSLANSGQSTEPSEKITEETIKHSVFHTKESSDSMNELNGNLNMKVGEHEGMEAPTTKKSKYKGVSDEEIARAQIAQAKTIAAASEAAAKKAKEQKHAKLVTAAGRSVASPAEAEPEPEDADIVAAPALAEEKEDTVGQPESVNREKQDQNEEQQGPREGNKADAVSEKHDITPKQPVDIKSPNTVEGPEAKSQKLENAAAPAVADESKNNSAISDNMGAVKSGDVPVLESTSKASLEGSAELERHDDL
ncbi:hypothetical protein KEM54_003823 [Ascosphaera aggregata]|nr:hypothetical protein KEM54_003823 [Ascosphaera aggregata]